MQIFRYISTIFLCCAVLQVQADEIKIIPGTEKIKARYTLEELVARSLKNYELLKTSRSEITRYRHEQDQASSWDNPEFGVTGGYKKDTSSGYLYGVTLSQTIPWPGKKSARAAIAGEEKNIARIRHEEMKLYVGHEVVRLAYRYHALKALTEHTSIRLKRLRLIDTFLRTRKILSPQKIVEKNIIRGRVKILQKSVMETRQQSRQAFSDLNLFTCFCVQEKAFPKIDISWYTRTPRIDAESQKKKALSRNFQIRRAMAVLTREKKKLGYEKKKTAPDLNVSLFYNEDNTGAAERSFGGGISFPLPVLNQNRGAVKAREADLSKAQLNLQFLERKLTQRLTGILDRYQTTSRLLKIFPVKSQNAIENQMRYADREFIRGRISLQNYLDMDEQAHEVIEAIYHTQINLVVLHTTLRFLSAEQ